MSLEESIEESIEDYPEIIKVKHLGSFLEYKRYEYDGECIYYKLTHKEELEYEDEEVEEGDYMLSKPRYVFRYLAVYAGEIHEGKTKTEYELGDFTKECIGDEDLYVIRNLDEE